MNDKLYMTPIVGWTLFDKGLSSITDNHDNSVSAWSVKCANGYEEGFVLDPDKVRMVKEIELATFMDLPGMATGTVDLGRHPSPLQNYCETAKEREKRGRD